MGLKFTAGSFLTAAMQGASSRAQVLGSCVRQTLNLSMCADSSTDTKILKVSHVTCHMSCVTCHMSHVTCLVSRVTCHLSPVTKQFSENHEYGRHWIFQRVQIEAQIPKHPQNLSNKNMRNKIRKFKKNLSCVTCHLLPMPAATAKYHPPANSSTMHSRLDCQDRTVCLGEQAEVPKQLFFLLFKTLKIVQTFPNKWLV